MALPKRIDVQIFDRDGKSVPRSFACVRILMPRKNHFNVWIGPSNTLGRIITTDAHLLASADREAHAFIMDYADPRDATGEVSVHACSIQEVERAIAAYKSFTPFFDYPPNWFADLLAARDALELAPHPLKCAFNDLCPSAEEPAE